MLVSSASCSLDRVQALQSETSELVHVVSGVDLAIQSLRQCEYTAIVIDQAIADSEPEAIGPLLEHAGGAVPVFLNLAISNPQRLAVEIKNALRRRRTEKDLANRTAGSELRDELRGAVTGILLSSELALAVPSVPPDAAAKIEEVRNLAESMRKHLEL